MLRLTGAIAGIVLIGSFQSLSQSKSETNTWVYDYKSNDHVPFSITLPAKWKPTKLKEIDGKSVPMSYEFTGEVDEVLIVFAFTPSEEVEKFYQDTRDYIKVVQERSPSRIKQDKIGDETIYIVTRKGQFIKSGKLEVDAIKTNFREKYFQIVVELKSNATVEELVEIEDAIRSMKFID